MYAPTDSRIIAELERQADFDVAQLSTSIATTTTSRTMTTRVPPALAVVRAVLNSDLVRHVTRGEPPIVLTTRAREQRRFVDRGYELTSDVQISELDKLIRLGVFRIKKQ